MRLTKSVASLASGVLLVGAALVAVATPAAAIDEGTQLDGAIYWFDTVGPLADQSPSTQITSGSGTARPWATLTTQNACPTGSTQVYAYLRIPQVGVPENEWTQVSLGGAIRTADAGGRFYSTETSQADRIALKSEVQAYNSAHGGAGDFPFLAVCRDDNLASKGYFETTVHIAGVDPMLSDASWSITSPSCDAGTECTGSGSGTEAQATTTTLTGAASGADLVLTATVAPTAAAGTVTFKESGTTLGSAPVSGGVATYTVTAPSQGTHAFTAEFAPSDSAAYQASTGSLDVTLFLDSATGQLVLTVPAATGTGSLTFSVPFDTPVQLVGDRSEDNSRIVATAAFPTVTVTDTRSDDLLGHWQVNAQASDFTGSAGTINAKYLGWTPSSSATPDAGSPLVTQNGAVVPSFLDDAASSGLSTSRPLGESATAGRGVATLDAALNLAIPGTTAEGQYTATVTVTLISD